MTPSACATLGRGLRDLPDNPHLWEGLARDVMMAGIKEAVENNADILLNHGASLLSLASIEKNFLGSTPDVAVRLYRNSRALIAVARAAIAAKSAGHGWRSVVNHWEEAAAELIDTTGGYVPAISPTWFGIDPQKPLELLKEIQLKLLADKKCPWPLSALYWWTAFSLGHEVVAERELRIPIVVAIPGGGFLADLALHWIADSPCELFEHPANALRAYKGDLVEVLRQQHAERTAGTVCWAIEPRVRGRGSIPLGGDSLGVSAAVGFELLAKKKYYDTHSVITGEIKADGSVGAVGSLDEKLGGILEAQSILFQEPHHGSYKFGIPYLQDLPEETITKYNKVGIEFQKLAKLSDAIEFASGLSTGFEYYFTKLCDLPDQDRPGYLGERFPTQLYIEPDVISWEPQPRSARGSDDRGHGDKGRRLGPDQGPRTEFGRESLDIGEEALFGRLEEMVERRRSWGEVRKDLAAGKTSTFVMLVGPPGQGKSHLALMTARQIANDSLRSLREGKSVDELAIPIRLTFQELLQPASAATAIRAAVRKSLSSTNPRQNGSLIKYTLDSLKRGHRVWIFIDGLDETSSDNDMKLQSIFTELKTLNCIVVMTSRPYRWDAFPGTFKPHVKQYRLAPFSDQQQQDFIRRWYGSDAVA